MDWNSADSVATYLESLPKFKSTGVESANFDLSRFRSFCNDMGNPQEDFAAIHVGGTNGKGSVCRILSHILQEAGYSVGLYTSPHIRAFSERFQINNEQISDDALVLFFEQYASLIEKYELSYFEISTAIAFWWFQKAKVDIAIIEVGLGGRLDATNIINPILSVITSIALDHTDILGDTIEEIAREKAGIINTETPVVIGDLDEKAKSVIREIASTKNSTVAGINDLQCSYSSWGGYVLEAGGHSLKLTSGLDAPVQRKNIATAWRCLQQIKDFFPTTVDNFAKGIAKTKSTEGRFEKLVPNKKWYFDGAHNLEAVQALKESVAAVGTVSQAVLVLSIMKDKLTAEIAKELSEFKNIFYYELKVERAATFNDINELLPSAHSFPSSRVQKLLSDKLESELVIFAGSFYFYSTVRDWVNNVD
ncbi:dihydrofolate synthase / folylpolyglutamate synthase [Fodinibius salinus]|uniref:Dihydrofolate synthase/folylpolyglutamate synthase n=1 Tax=Fodinibius salinus TaxID=860790 RepID=A0A5D3YJ62_9BACT|nr:folylpolyglutamate synthase/dihydrofolate synthase family protein [Fodinibius salinus]TYP92775.1 dihydrofolate synthase / folylpolyglutamate synthase [Fodinibius salinus]